jgi:DNA-binding IclR family transcriptional regulator
MSSTDLGIAHLAKPGAADTGASGVSRSSSAARVLSVLEHTLAAAAPPTVTELALIVNLPRTTVADIAVDLAEAEYIRLVDGRVLAGPSLGRLAARLDGRPGLRSRIRPVLARLAAESGETAQASAASRSVGGELPLMFGIDAVESSQPIRYVFRPGRREQLWPSAVGKIFLAFNRIPAARIPDAWLIDGAASRRQIDRELAGIRRQGYSLTEHIQGLTAIAAPIRDEVGNVTAAIAIAGPPTRMTAPAERFWPMLSRALKTLPAPEAQSGE